MIIDFYDAGGAWVDCCDATQFDIQHLAAILSAKHGPVRWAKRENVRYVKGAALDFSAWLMTA